VFALSTTEAEYVALSTMLRDVIPVIHLLKEMQEHGYMLTVSQPSSASYLKITVARLSKQKQLSFGHKPDRLMLPGIIFAPMWQKG
jgi:hypothetical protein